MKINKYVKDGGSMVAVGSDLYAFPGNKSWYFYKYSGGAWDSIGNIPFGVKPPPDTTNKEVKKKIGKGAALCYDGMNTIYATKGNGTREFWAYSLTDDVGWTLKAFVPPLKGLKAGSAIAYLNGAVYLLVGNVKTGDFFFRYDIGTDVWTALPNPTAGTKPWKAGSAITAFDNKIYAMKGGEKPNHFCAYDPMSGWITPNETLTTFDSVWSGSAWKYKKVYLKDGAALSAADDGIYGIKGGGSFNFFKYTPGTGWVQLQSDTITRLSKRSVPKTGAALAYANGVLYLIKGSNTPEFWQYVSAEKSKVQSQKSKLAEPVIANPTQSGVAISNNSSLLSITPNPFTNTTTIRYNVPISGNVSIKLYNSTGSLVNTLLSGYQNKGDYTLNLSNIASGVYFLRYQHNKGTSEVKLIVQ
ncbi:MAG: T9SS type A sorting domain-containing protein [Candidatus Latescibacteria bacterium]|nr:T9SS type A sorting domain-containing protein [Candidatus Latescibacterota bacterium]